MRVGVVGFGLAGAVFHAPLIAAVDGLSVAAVVTRDARRAAKARSEHPGVAVVGSVDELWAVEPELVVVASPDHLHGPHALAAIERGIPVVVDKPFAPSADEAAQVLAAAEAAGVAVHVFQNRRWDGDFLTVRRLVAEGAFGRVLRFVSRFERFRAQVGTGWREEAGGGGPLFDLGAHLVDQAVLLFGPPVRVYAEVDRRRAGALVADDVFVALEHAGGERSHLHMGAVGPVPAPRLTVAGLGGGFACEGLDPQEHQLMAGARPGDRGFGERPPGRRFGADPAGPSAQPLDRGDYAAFYRAVAAGETPVDPRDAVAVLRVLEAARRSAETRAVIEIEERA